MKDQLDELMEAEAYLQMDGGDALSGKSLPSGSPAGCHFASDHDYAGAIRVGRAHHECPKCGKDITLELTLFHVANACGEPRKIKGKQ